MTGEEWKFLHPAPCRKYMENLEKSCRAQCKGSHPELCKYSRATRECYNDRCFRIHLKGTRHKQTPASTQVPSTTPRTTNQQQAMIATQNLAYNRPRPLLNTPHQAWHRHSPCPLTNSYHTPPPTQYLTTHQTIVPLYPNPPPLHAIPYTTSSSSTPTQSLHPPLTSPLAPQTHYPSFPSIVIPPQSHTPHLITQDGYQRTTQRGTTVNDHIFFYGKRCKMYNNNWTTWWRW